MEQAEAEQLFQSALDLHQAGKLRQAESVYEQVLAFNPNHAQAVHFLGAVLFETGRQRQGIAMIRKAIELEPNRAEFHCNLGVMLIQTGQEEQAIPVLRRALEISPEFPQALSALGAALQSIVRLEEAIALLQKAVRLAPDYGEAHNNLGSALMDAGKIDEAIVSLRTAAKLRPDLARAHANLAHALRERGQVEEALAAAQQAVKLQPDDFMNQLRLGNTLQDAGRSEEAISAFDGALSLQPNSPAALFNRANALHQCGKIEESITQFERAVAAHPHYFQAHYNLSLAYKDLAKIEDAIHCCDRAIQIEPNHAGIQGGRIYYGYFKSDYDPIAHLAELGKWNERFVAPMRSRIVPPANDRSPERRLRIGYVSGDFRAHVVGRNLLPLLRNHDRSKFEIFCYSNVRRQDSLTKMFSQLCDGWRDILNLGDGPTAAQIREDRIDILMDLTLHMDASRLGVFALKPAPVQGTFAGYPGSTGVETIDFRLTDPHLDPGAFNSHYTEKSIPLRDSFWCYEGDADDPPVGNLPALTSGFVTFGCLNNFCKVNEYILKVWGDVLKRVPNSRVAILAPFGSVREWVISKLDVSPQRVGFAPYLPRRDYLTLYHHIDIGLDAYPYNGHTTSLDSMWMGVPVVTLRGPMAIARAGFSQAANVGLADEVVADNADQFVEIAAKMAANLPHLANLRKSLRSRMQQSPLMDAAGFARNIEEAYRSVWRSWCQAAR